MRFTSRSMSDNFHSAGYEMSELYFPDISESFTSVASTDCDVRPDSRYIKKIKSLTHYRRLKI